MRVNNYKIYLKSITLVLFILMMIMLVACNGMSMRNLKEEQCKSLRDYVVNKGEENYSNEDWVSLQEIASIGEAKIRNAKKAVDIKMAVSEITMEIDGIMPIKSDNLTNGVYFVTDLSWIRYVRLLANQLDKDEKWIQNVIDSDGEYIVPVIRKKNLWVVVKDGKLTLSTNIKRVYQIDNVNGIYACQVVNENIPCWVLDDTLFVKSSKYTMQFKRDASYQVSDSETQLNAAIDVEATKTDLRWKYPGNYPPAGFCCGSIDILYPNAQEFTAVAVVDWLPPPDSFFVINYQALCLKEGVNIIRIHHVGGPYFTNNYEVLSSTNSEYTSLKLLVDETGKVTIIE